MLSLVHNKSMAGEKLFKNDILITICNFNIVVIFAYFNWWCQLVSTIHKSYLVHMIILFKMRKYLLHLNKFYYVWRIIDFFLQKAPFSTLNGPKLSKPSLLISFHLKTKAPQIHKQNLTIRFRDTEKRKKEEVQRWWRFAWTRRMWRRRWSACEG